MYTQKVDMLLIIGECHTNAKNADELYAQRYPIQQHPAHQYFLYCENSFRWERNRKTEQTFIINKETESNVLALVEVNKTF